MEILSDGRHSSVGVGSTARAIFAGGAKVNTEVNTIEFVTIANTGNVTDFGDMTVAKQSHAGASNNTRGVFGGGELADGSRTNVIEYITVATAGDSADFGDLTLDERKDLAAVSSPTRAVFAGGSSNTGGQYENHIEFVTIANTGNSTDFGNLSKGMIFQTAASSQTRGVFAGGQDYAVGNDVDIDFITIANTGNTTDFGDFNST